MASPSPRIVHSDTAIFPASIQPAVATPRQIALAFLTLRPSVFAIPKASSVDHVEENAGASGVHLSKLEIARIDAAFPRGPRRGGLPML
jgi:diketogulonate reductase-like aldo/keto reductase